jgi:hypothetical protein
VSARFVAALTSMVRLANELTDVLGAVIVGPPSRAVAQREIEPVVLVKRTPEARRAYIVAAAQSGAIAAELAEQLLIALDDPPPGLVPCPTCGTEQGQREGGRMAVHFATREAIRPCPGSWPARPVAAKGRAA